MTRERISLAGTSAIKWAVLLFQVAFVTFWMTGVVNAGLQGFRQAWWMALAAIPFVALLVYLQWSFIRRCADEVSIEGESLTVRFGDETLRIPLSAVISVDKTGFSTLPLITLRLRKPILSRDRIVFIPRVAFSPNPFARNKVGEKLILLVDRARQMEHAK